MPENWKIVSLLAIGYKDEGYTPKPQRRLSLKYILIIK